MGNANVLRFYSDLAWFAAHDDVVVVDERSSVQHRGFGSLAATALCTVSIQMPEKIAIVIFRQR